MGKLVLSRRVGERVAIDETTFVSVERIRGDVVRLGFEAPRYVRIVRDELDRTDAAKSTDGVTGGWSTENRPSREDYETYIAYKRALERYIYWLGQEKVSMQMKLKDAIASHVSRNHS